MTLLLLVALEKARSLIHDPGQLGLFAHGGPLSPAQTHPEIRQRAGHVTAGGTVVAPHAATYHVSPAMEIHPQPKDKVRPYIIRHNNGDPDISTRSFHEAHEYAKKAAKGRAIHVVQGDTTTPAAEYTPPPYAPTMKEKKLVSEGETVAQAPKLDQDAFAKVQLRLHNAMSKAEDEGQYDYLFTSLGHINTLRYEADSWRNLNRALPNGYAPAGFAADLLERGDPRVASFPKEVQQEGSDRVALRDQGRQAIKQARFLVATSAPLPEWEATIDTLSSIANTEWADGGPGKENSKKWDLTAQALRSLRPGSAAGPGERSAAMSWIGVSPGGREYPPLEPVPAPVPTSAPTTEPPTLEPVDAPAMDHEAEATRLAALLKTSKGVASAMPTRADAEAVAYALHNQLKRSQWAIRKGPSYTDTHVEPHADGRQWIVTAGPNT